MKSLFNTNEKDIDLLEFLKSQKILYIILPKKKRVNNL